MDTFDFSGFLEASGGEIQGRLERASFYKHPSGVGDGREDIIRDVLKDMLPERFSVDRGKIIDSQGRLSKEFDVVISEADDVVPPMIVSGRRIIPVEAVYGVIEVKSRLDEDGYRGFVNAVIQLDEMKRFYRPIVGMSDELRTKINVGISVQDDDFGRLWSGIIAADAPQGETLSRWLQDYPEGLWFICVPNRELVTISLDPEGWVSCGYGEKSLPFLVWVIMDLLTSSRRRLRLLPNMRKYREYITDTVAPVTVSWSATVSDMDQEQTES